jgi:hypothetical protein
MSEITTTAGDLAATLAEIDRLNEQDPNREECNGELVAKEVLYSQRMSQWLVKFNPDAGDLLQIAAHAQHIQRWKIPRRDYPMDRAGYKRWRVELGAFHGETTASVMSKHGYSEDDQQRVKDLLLKKNLKRDDETQTLEDVICLVFIEFYLSEFVTKHTHEKLLVIIQKTWNKMSEPGHEQALKISLTPELTALVTEALS